jgi:hypothetical protein
MVSRIALAGFAAGVIAAVLVVLGPWSRSAPLRKLHEDFPVLDAALDQLAADCGRRPTAAEGLAALVDRPASADLAAHWRGPYVDRSRLIDYFGRPYVFLPVEGIRGHGAQLIIWSAGPDGQPYTRDDVFEFGHLRPPWKGKPDG